MMQPPQSGGPPSSPTTRNRGPELPGSILTLVGGGVAVVGFFMPWVNVSGLAGLFFGPYDGWDLLQRIQKFASLSTSGHLTLFVLCIWFTLVFTLVPLLTGGFGVTGRGIVSLAIIQTVGGGLAFIITLVALYAILPALFQQTPNFILTISLGPGPFVTLLGLLVSIIGGFITTLALRQQRHP
jgi:hypothetical protein